MTSPVSQPPLPSRERSSRRGGAHGGRWVLLLCLAVGSASCGTAPPRAAPGLPPSASDLELLGATRLCGLQDDVVRRWRGAQYRATPWGSGEQLQRSTPQAPGGRDEFYFFNDERILVGAVFRFDPGLNLTAYPVLRKTLSQLVPASTFYLDPSQLLSNAQAKDAVLYRTGDKTSTTQYLVREENDQLLLLTASMALDPYEQLLSGYHEQFLPGLKRSRPAESAGDSSPGGAPNKAFPGLQQFARGEAALFGSCGVAQPHIAGDAYRRAIRHGIRDPRRLAEAHHRLGLALRDQGLLADAQHALEDALSMQPQTPEIINSLGRVLAEQQHWDRAMALFERAIILRPNFADARFNLGESLDRLGRDTRRAIEEYETYLALVEGIPGEDERVARVQERVKRLKGE